MSPAAAFALLATADAHRRLTTPAVTLLELDLTATGGLAGGVILIKGPLRVQRVARTRVTATAAPALLTGTATTDSGTEIRVGWELSATPAGTQVALRAHIKRAARRDRLLLAAGGRRWLRRVLAATLRRLETELVGSHDPRAPSPAASASPQPVNAG